MPLTDTECRNAKCPPGRARLRMTDGLGLYLEVLPAGASSSATARIEHDVEILQFASSRAQA